MKLYVKFDYNAVCNKVLKETLESLALPYELTAFGEISFNRALTSEELRQLTTALDHYDIGIVESQKSILVQKIKDAIIQMVFTDDVHMNIKSSAYLSEKLGHSYGFLASTFSEYTYSSIESFIILQKIEYTKQLILIDELSLTEISYKLNYSSVAHLSTQFKNVTGLTPSMFMRIIKKRNLLTHKNH